MSTRILIAICGAACALAPANAQTANQRDRDQTKQYERTQQDARGLSGATIEGESLLQDLEGVWRVEAVVNVNYLKMVKKNAHAGENAMQDAQRRQDGYPRNDDDQSTMASDAKHENIRGVAETRVILGNVLQGEAYIMRADGKNSDKIDWKSADEGMKCLSYIAFNPDTGSYDAVFMNNKDNEMMYSAGTYDQANRRIVFQGTPGDSGSAADRAWDRLDTGRPDMNRPDTNRRDIDRREAERDETNRGDRGNRTDRDRPDREQNARGPWNEGDGNRSAQARGSGEVTVVLEVLGKDKHRVTMYRGAPDLRESDSGSIDRPGTDLDHESSGARPTSRDQGLRDEANRNNPDRANRDRDNKDRGERSMSDGSDLAGNIVYRATYTRVDGAEAAEFRRKIDELADGDRITRR